MQRTVEIGTYSPRGIELVWTPGFVLDVSMGAAGDIRIRANREGLISLAQHALTLAEEQVPAGTHIHLSAYDALEPGSADVVIERVGFESSSGSG